LQPGYTARATSGSVRGPSHRRPAHLRLEDLVSHHFPLAGTGAAFEMNARCAEGVHKIMIDVAAP
jgi:hypothetical protein